MKIISVIGGSGFIGTSLVTKLKSKKTIDVSIIDKVNSATYPSITKIADVRSVSQLRNSLPSDSVIINLAAEHHDDVRPLNLYFDVNVTGAKNICQISIEKNIKKIIFVSSVAVYGFTDNEADEFSKISPCTEYGSSKWQAEVVFKKWHEADPTERTLVIVRPTVVFGERNRGNFYRFLSYIYRGRFAMIGDGKNRKSIAYVENLAAFLEHSLHFAPGVHIFNYADKPDLSLKELVSLVHKILGFPNRKVLRFPFFIGTLIGKFFDFFSILSGFRLPISSIRIKKLCINSVYETSVSRTGFKAPFRLEDALQRTIEFEFLTRDQPWS